MTSTKSNLQTFDLDRTSATVLRFLFWGIGGSLMLAAFALLLPVDRMAAIHQWLGLGELPRAPIVAYLARSTSLMYAVHGILMVAVACSLKRSFHLVPLLGWIHVGIGAVMLLVDLTAPMPWYWTALEGGPIAAGGVLILVLFRAALADPEAVDR